MVQVVTALNVLIMCSQHRRSPTPRSTQRFFSLLHSICIKAIEHINIEDISSRVYLLCPRILRFVEQRIGE